MVVGFQASILDAGTAPLSGPVRGQRSVGDCRLPLGESLQAVSALRCHRRGRTTHLWEQKLSTRDVAGLLVSAVPPRLLRRATRMNLNLHGKSAVVTGASKGIGLAITRALVAEGVHVTAGARHSTEALSNLVVEGAVHTVEVDLGTPQGPALLVESALSAFGPPDILINNVGATRPRTGGFASVTDADWTNMLNINFLSAVRASREVLPLMLERGSGAIVTVASVNSRLPDPLVIDYSAAKAALLNFSKSLSKEVGPRGIRVNTVSPGPVSTDLWLGEGGVAATVGEAGGLQAQDVAASAAGQSVTGRFSRPEEVADMVLFLASDRSGNTTGADVIIDGGLITTI